MKSETTSLHRITQLPLDANGEIFRHYAAFKLGVTSAVRHYAQLLLPLVKRLIAESEQTGWIITAPGIATQTPAGANLLCWELFDLYTRERNSQELSSSTSSTTTKPQPRSTTQNWTSRTA